jgi:hypothetical protein
MDADDQAPGQPEEDVLGAALDRNDALSGDGLLHEIDGLGSHDAGPEHPCQADPLAQHFLAQFAAHRFHFR